MYVDRYVIIISPIGERVSRGAKYLKNSIHLLFIDPWNSLGTIYLLVTEPDGTGEILSQLFSVYKL